MNNIQEKDWAEEDWAGHSGMCSISYDGGDANSNGDGRDVPVKAESAAEVSKTS